MSPLWGFWWGGGGDGGQSECGFHLKQRRSGVAYDRNPPGSSILFSLRDQPGPIYATVVMSPRKAGEGNGREPKKSLQKIPLNVAFSFRALPFDLARFRMIENLTAPGVRACVCICALSPRAIQRDNNTYYYCCKGRGSRGRGFCRGILNPTHSTGEERLKHIQRPLHINLQSHRWRTRRHRSGWDLLGMNNYTLRLYLPILLRAFHEQMKPIF